MKLVYISVFSTIEFLYLCNYEMANELRDKSGRPTFIVDGFEVMAAGFTMYAWSDGWLLLMMRTKRRGQLVWEDLGGKTDPADVDFCTTAAREVWEESNGFWPIDKLLEVARNSSYVIGSGKYAHFFVEVEWFEDTARLGTQEEHDGIERTFEWVTLDEVKHAPRHVRLDRGWFAALKAHLRRERFSADAAAVEPSASAPPSYADALKPDPRDQEIEELRKQLEEVTTELATAANKIGDLETQVEWLKRV